MQPDTPVLIEIGSGAVQSYDERALRDMFPDLPSAFNVAPTSGLEPTWYYLDDVQQEQGPFSSKQMRLWLDDGYFSSQSRVRSAGQAQGRPISGYFQDPMMAFMQGGGAESRPMPAVPAAQRPIAAQAIPVPLPIMAPVRQPAYPASDLFDPFGAPTPASQPPMAKQPSGKALLQEAFFNAGPAPSSTGDEVSDESRRSFIESGGGGGGANNQTRTNAFGRSFFKTKIDDTLFENQERARAMTYEDTLDLFDRVGLEDEEEESSSTAASAKQGKPKGRFYFVRLPVAFSSTDSPPTHTHKYTLKPLKAPSEFTERKLRGANLRRVVLLFVVIVVCCEGLLTRFPLLHDVGIARHSREPFGLRHRNVQLFYSAPSSRHGQSTVLYQARNRWHWAH